MNATSNNEVRSRLSRIVSRWKPLLLAVALFIGAGIGMPLSAQTGTHRVSGQVISNGESVIGASVMVKGTSQGTATM